MGPKLLFVMGIVLAHGAVGAAWIHRESPQPRAAGVCVNIPAPLPYFRPPGELLAMRVAEVGPGDTMQP